MFPQRLKELRKRKKLTQTELGEIMNVSYKTVGSWERGERQPSYETAKMIADYFEVSTDYLLGNNVPDWASDDDVVDLYKMLESNVNMAYGGENLTEEEKQRVKDVLTGIFWEKLEKIKKKWFYMTNLFNDSIKNIYTKYNTLDPFEIAESCNIEIRYESFLKSPSGQYVVIHDQKIILINHELADSNERYFVMAHELYHALMHSELSGYYIQNSFSRGKLENEANKFAVNLLANRYVEEYGLYPSSYDELYNLYGIPKDILETYID